jgi:hypothetical protein
MVLPFEYRIVPASEMPGLAAGMSRLMRLNSLPKSSNGKKIGCFRYVPIGGSRGKWKPTLVGNHRKRKAAARYATAILNAGLRSFRKFLR